MARLDGWMRDDMEEEGYVCYLLRLWRSRSGRDVLWRASLEDVHSGERRGFAGVDALWAYLQGWVEGADSAAGEGTR